MRIVVTGGAGAMALPAAIYCLEQEDVTHVELTDVDKARLDERIAQLDDKRVGAEVLDLMDVEASAKLFRGADAVLNAAFATTCIPATEAALKAGVNYTDLGAYQPEEQLGFDEGFREKGVTAVVSMGTAPGMSNVMAAYGAAKLDRIESIDIQDVCADMVPHEEHSRPLYWGYAIESILEEFTDEAQVMENGEIKGYNVEGQTVSPRAVLVALLNNQPPETKRTPDFRGHMMVVVRGEESGQKVEYTVTEYATAALTERMQRRGVFSSYRTGIYVGITTMMLARGHIAEKGVFYPEVSIPAELFLREAARAGIEVDVSRKVAM